MKERVITAIVLLAVVIVALFLDPTGWAVKLLIALIAGIADRELGQILTGRGGYVLGSLMIMLLAFFWISAIPTLVFPAVGLISALGIVAFVKRAKPIVAELFGTCWIWATILPMYVLASTKQPSYWPLLMTAAIPIWCGDTAAIFVGKAFGKHKMAPDISPKKTWEGAAGNFIACILASVILGAIFHYPMLAMVLLGINTGILGQAGDLFESWLKRRADMKDSGNILPGHGGVLDRIDSLMATAPISLLIIQLLVIPAAAK